MSGTTSPVDLPLDVLVATLDDTASVLEDDGKKNMPIILRAVASMLRDMSEREKALREALEKIANHPTGGVGCNPVVFVEIARKELEPK
jgi:hypothetical protein